MPANPTFKKREKERARQERQREKDAKRKQRREDRKNRPEGAATDELESDGTSSESPSEESADFPESAPNVAPLLERKDDA